MFLKLKLSEATAMGVHPKATEVLVNMDHVVQVSPDTDESAKLTFSDGHTRKVLHTVTKIDAMLSGNLETGYKAPEPKDP